MQMSDIFVLKFTYSFKILAFCHRNEAMALTTVYFSGVFSQQVQVVGGHDDGRPLGSDFAQQFHNHPSGLHVQVTRRLVGQQDFRFVQDGPGDDDTLLLAAR